MKMTISAADLLAISTTSAEFGRLVDLGRATECEGLFHSDARLIFGPGSPKPGALEGLEAIRAFLAARQSQTHVTTRHIATNFRATPAANGQVELHSLLTVFRSDDETREPLVSTVADIEETFCLDQDGEWKILERLTTPIFLRK